MASTDTNPNARRIRWALLIALGLHLLLAWRFLPDLSTTFETVRKAISDEAVVEIKAPPPLMSQGMVMSTKLGEASSARLPKGFFDKPKGMAGGRLEISDDLDFSRKSGVQIVANIIPGALKLRNVNTLSEQARTPAPKPADKARSQATPDVKAVTATQVAEVEVPQPAPTLFQPPPASPPPLPFLLPEPELPPPPEPSARASPVREVDVDAVIARAADAAERLAREVRNSARQPAPDYRAMLPQGSVVEAAPPTPKMGERSPDAGQPSTESGITTFALDAPVARDRNRAAPEDGKSASAARQQFFSLLTARLKATNNRVLAEAIKAGPRTTVRMSFLVERDGSVVGISPGDPISRVLAERAAAVIRAAQLPPVPDSMTEVPLELSFPIEVYR